MEHLDDREVSENNVDEVEVTNNTPLICGLPDDISLLCLARVPRKYHSVLKAVSKRWKDLVCSEEWLYYRRKHKLDETWIYALCRDKLDHVYCYVLDPTSSRKSWKLIHGVPPHVMKRKGMGFEALGNKLFLLGGCGWSEDATDEVYSYNASLNLWVEAASLSTARCYFACEAMDEKLYAIGGIGSNSSDPQSWDTFDPCTNGWTSHRDPNIVPEIEDSMVMNGKIYIRGGESPLTPHVYAVVYEPSNGTWQHADTDMVSGWRGPAVVVDGIPFVLDQSSGTRLTMWHKERREWILVCKLSPLLTRPPCQLVAVGKSIYIIGKGLSTVVVDVGDIGNMGRAITGSSIPKLVSDYNVISCKCLSI
ncbi:putative F-box domain, galactose oxidase, beta-propeller [Medicago truncatula]|uniref:Putative F-box domain, galactose oxidase, beta-propeller n=1 Tax=Medicago truncatula TaxID=3880 RepID=A0A072TN21_MEDTR|nr:F-box/kelch-repeat protein SKIP4 [Medicago truncatula]KEH18864.1 SKP1 interacting partner 4 [Medicago truncatula]RHN39904.1 putative F-box domain, galactose oxidase, beta-propeller [Medicago truncatula]